ncbi:hypothetical protein [Bradyrhizobium sp. sGM-13]|uniref:hypothetical protein n=1 Tax=Bradyrhizobium sp. sGM-13 TaxID=2831781 RepID=UPI001BCBD9E8|nr:hypothetical protein [Bradyrhizobium sp. sGM-13]
MPAYTTIITSIKDSCADSCREYLRDHVDPACTKSGPRCSPEFRFDLIPTLHFCSFSILDKEDEFDAYLVFEATFDGSREDFLSDLLRLAPDGMHELYSHCVGYPVSGHAIPHITREFLLRHDVGAHTFFCGSPGRSAVQIQDEHRLRTAIVEHLSTVTSTIPPRLSGLFEDVRSFIRSKTNYRWAEQPPPVPWEVRFRRAIVAAALALVAITACGFGVALAARFGLGPFSMNRSILAILAWTNQFGTILAAELAVLQNPWLDVALQAAVPLVGLSFIWILIRFGELRLSGSSKRPRDQSFARRFFLHIAIILRSGTLVFLAGATALAFLEALKTSPGSGSLLMSLFLLGVVLLALLVLQHYATTLKLSARLTKLTLRQEAERRLRLDLVNFGRAISVAFGILVIARYLPLTINGNLADFCTIVVEASLVIVAYGVIGALAAYAIGFILFLEIRRRERRDKRKLGDPAELMARARVNAAKYAREESGNNARQNHLASVTRVKPGLFRICLLRGALFVIGLLSRFWYNRGELGGIPTILSARWVLIDRGRRLLFLDNYGGAWESYLNEFIDMTAVKGLNAIWTNTFVKVHGRSYGFPETRFLFWRGAQAERPFKAYVRESQIETIAWYSAYLALSVVNINANSRLRRSLSKSPTAPEIDTVFQNL